MVPRRRFLVRQSASRTSLALFSREWTLSADLRPGVYVKDDHTPRTFPPSSPAAALTGAGSPGGEGWLHEIKFDGYRKGLTLTRL
jgi:ATP-dependent DNA ligase